ncbi:alpha/beta fold hydrolase [Streptomyces sp. SID3212]|uniref:alpha/beta fold hydrolase n=1 Tax=Streptomyces sp. SID3212 TaxID=2690259 RepID=UPI00136EF163|nr:alpha/beta fold hydrolase [Streptomyces sp. SID3212]MYV57206.1 alpha/beta fold hydrolase [Streptomyces sp. SID3212]
MDSIAASPVAVTLPLLRWGPPDASRHALLLHGLTSAGACWWRLADDLAAAGWAVTAPDLRGHGLAPRTLRYDIAGFAADVLALTPEHTGGPEDTDSPEHTTVPRPWDLVVGHSLGGLVATAAADTAPGWAARLLLIDPVITVAGGADGLVHALTDELRAEPDTLLRDHPLWHPEDVFLKVQAAARTSPYVVESFLRQNIPWSYESALARTTCPVTVLAADPRHGPSFTAEEARRVQQTKADFHWSVVEGAGHSVQRDAPAAVSEAALTE